MEKEGGSRWGRRGEAAETNGFGRKEKREGRGEGREEE